MTHHSERRAMQTRDTARLPWNLEGVALELDRGERVNEAQVGRDLADVVVGEVDALDRRQIGQAWERQHESGMATRQIHHISRAYW